MRATPSDFAHLSGSGALDVLNTVDWRLDPERAIEQLDDINAVLAWCRESGFVGADEGALLQEQAAAHPQSAEEASEDFRCMREDAYQALIEHDSAAVARFARRQQQAFESAGLRPDGQGWVWRDSQLDLRTPGHRVVRALAELMRAEAITRLRQCADDICGWVYLDTSPRRNRRWCAAKDCGDRNRARAYYRRKQEASR